MKLISVLTLSLALSGCGVMTVSTDELRPGSSDGIVLTTIGRTTYDQVWKAATSAMSNGMSIVESHRPSGTIKSRVGSAPSGKVVAIFITPTTPDAREYKIQLVSKTPQGFNSPERRTWEPSVVRDFEAALIKNK